MSNRKSRLIVFSLIFTFFLSCDTNIDIFDGGKSGDTILRGKVVDKADSMPLDSVSFTLSYSKIMQNSSYEELKPKTDSTGSFYFEIYCMEEYSYRFYNEKDGYLPNLHITYPLTIDKAEDNYFYIEMERDTTKVK